MALTQVSSKGIKNLTLLNEDVNASADIAGSKLADNSISLAKLVHGDSNNNGKFLRANNGADPTFETVSTDLVADTSPQLGGYLDTNGNNIQMLDNDRLRIGTSYDLEIYHDNSSSLNLIDSKTTQLRIETDALRLRSDSGATYLEADVNAAVKIYHANSKKFETLSNGVKVTGNIELLETGADIRLLNDGGKLLCGAGSDLQVYHDGSNSYIKEDGDGGLYQQTNGNGIFLQKTDGTAMANFVAGGGVELFYNGTKKFETNNDGLDIDGSIYCNDLVTAGAVLHENDTNTLMHFDSNDNIAFKTDGTVRVRINNNGLLFNADTGSDNALSDYEEGPWTPTITFGGGSAGQSYSAQIGRYIKIGRLVHIQCYIAFSDKGSSTGTAKISGLPYASRNQSGMYASAKVAYIHNVSSSSGPGGISDFLVYIEVNDTVLNIDRQELGNSGTGVNDATDSNFNHNTDMMITMTYVAN